MNDGTNKKVKIDLDVPIPKKWRGRHDYVNDMPVNGSILFDNWDDAERCRDALRKRKIPYTARKVYEDGENKWRVWRTG